MSEGVIFQLHHGENKLIFYEMMMMMSAFLLDKHAQFDLYGVSSLKQQSGDGHVAPLGHIILIPSKLVFAFFLMLFAQRRSNTYQFYRLWFYPIRARTHDLPHSRHRTCITFMCVRLKNWDKGEAQRFIQSMQFTCSNTTRAGYINISGGYVSVYDRNI